MIAIPAIDIMGGQCVRLLRGDFDQRRSYNARPLDQAKAIEDAGITHLHLVDLDGARQGQPKNLDVLEQLAAGTSLAIDFGGGIRSLEDAASALNAGASQVNIGTLLFAESTMPQQCIERFQKERLIAAIDINEGKVAVHGWQTQTNITANEAILSLHKVGWETISVTDISRDGTMQGPNPDFYLPLVEAFPQLKFIGGGGVASVEHLLELKNCGLYAAVTGKAIFEGTISLAQLSAFNT
jgi:phosphoribosylformimino-5-aminoimidazole carboxamide ribotide isomerase